MQSFSIVVPWASTYPTSAATMVKVAEADPLFPGEEGVRRTLALYVALGIFESGLKPDAEGDCVTATGRAVASVGGVCPTGSRGNSYCMFQVSQSNFQKLEITKDEIQSTFEICTRAMHKLVKISFGVCRSKASNDDRLAHYAHGGETCGGPKGEGLLESQHRSRKAHWLYSNKKFLEGLD
jgi:hypothetical protein